MQKNEPAEPKASVLESLNSPVSVNRDATKYRAYKTHADAHEAR